MKTYDVTTEIFETGDGSASDSALSALLDKILPPVIEHIERIKAGGCVKGDVAALIATVCASLAGTLVLQVTEKEDHAHALAYVREMIADGLLQAAV